MTGFKVTGKVGWVQNDGKRLAAFGMAEDRKVSETKQQGLVGGDGFVDWERGQGEHEGGVVFGA